MNLVDENGPWVYWSVLDTTDEDDNSIEPVNPTDVITKATLSPAHDTDIVSFDDSARDEKSNSPYVHEEKSSQASINIIEEKTTVVGFKPTSRVMANITNNMRR